MEGTRTMVYKNANRRILILVKAGMIEEVKYTQRVPHGRIDYKLTIRGLIYLIPHFLNNPDEIKGLVEYMNKSGLDTKVFDNMLADRISSMLNAANEYRKYAKLPIVAAALSNDPGPFGKILEKLGHADAVTLRIDDETEIIKKKEIQYRGMAISIDDAIWMANQATNQVRKELKNIGTDKEIKIDARELYDRIKKIKYSNKSIEALLSDLKQYLPTLTEESLPKKKKSA